jgi:hypothetical protein
MVIGIVGALAVGYAAYYVTGAGFTVVSLRVVLGAVAALVL